MTPKDIANIMGHRDIFCLVNNGAYLRMTMRRMSVFRSKMSNESGSTKEKIKTQIIDQIEALIKPHGRLSNKEIDLQVLLEKCSSCFEGARENFEPKVFSKVETAFKTYVIIPIINRYGNESVNLFKEKLGASVEGLEQPRPDGASAGILKI